MGFIDGIVATAILSTIFGLFHASIKKIHYIDVIGWSWEEAKSAVQTSIFFTFILAFGLGFIWLILLFCFLGPFAGIMDVAYSFLLPVLIVAIGGGPLVLIMSILLEGFNYQELNNKIKPDESIIRSARNAIIVGPIAGIICAILLGGISGETSAFIVGTAFGFIAGLGIGGNACLRHIAIRFFLVSNGVAPWRYVRFLNHAADRIFLRKVGNGYSFVHRMLMEHFASQYVEISSKEIQSPPQESDEVRGIGAALENVRLVRDKLGSKHNKTDLVFSAETQFSEIQSPLQEIDRVQGIENALTKVRLLRNNACKLNNQANIKKSNRE